MKKTLNILFILCFFSIFQAQKRGGKLSEEDEALFVFSKCKNLSGAELNSCGKTELKEFVLRNLEYPQQAVDSGYEGRVIVKFVIEKEGNIGDVSISNDTKIHKLLADEALRVTQNLKDSISSGEISVIPAHVGRQKVRSYFRLPITFRLPENQVQDESYHSQPSSPPPALNEDEPYHSQQMVVATYRDREDTIQYRKSLQGTLYAYSLSNGSEKLLAVLNEPSMGSDQKYYLYLLDLALSRREVLVNFGKIYGQEVEMYLDRGTKPDDEGTDTDNDNDMKIKIYKAGDVNQPPIKIFDNFSDLYNSPYAALLLK